MEDTAWKEVEDLVLVVLGLAEKVKALPPLPSVPSFVDEHVSPFERANKARHKHFAAMLRRLGFSTLQEDGYFVHSGGTKVHWCQIEAAWDRRSTSEILATLAYVRGRPALARELWRVM